jgi:hypothetical protein
LLLLLCVNPSRGRVLAVPVPPNPDEIHIPRGRAIVVDGVKSAGEWDDASMTQFSVAPGWNVRVFAKHDAQNLYFDFEGVTHAGSRLFPVILLDPRHTQSPAWQKGQWWLHVSNNLCESNGAPSVYEKMASFDARTGSPAGTEIIRRTTTPSLSKLRFRLRSWAWSMRRG